MSLTGDLRASPFFRHLPEKTLDRVAPVVIKRVYGGGQLIFQQGEAASGFFVILSGQVKLRISSGTGREQVLHFFTAGDSFGEAAILGEGSHLADAVCMTDTHLAFIPAEPFLAEIRRDPDLAFQVMRSMANRLGEFVHIIENLSIREVKARLACYLLRQQQSRGDVSGLDLPVGKGELARLLGTTAESLSRALRSLVEQGAIRVEGKRITLIDQDSLIGLSGD